MLPRRELSNAPAWVADVRAGPARPTRPTRLTAVETSTYLHRPAAPSHADEAWMAATSGYEDAMAQLVLRKPGAVERVRAAAQALQALQAATAAQPGFEPDDLAA